MFALEHIDFGVIGGEEKEEEWGFKFDRLYALVVFLLLYIFLGIVPKVTKFCLYDR
jgi:hypothetical protein